MTFKPHTGDFYVLEAIRPDLTTVPIAIGGDRQEMIDFTKGLTGRYMGVFIAFSIIHVPSVLDAIDEMLATPTHDAPKTRN